MSIKKRKRLEESGEQLIKQLDDGDEKGTKQGTQQGGKKMDTVTASSMNCRGGSRKTETDMMAQHKQHSSHKTQGNNKTTTTVNVDNEIIVEFVVSQMLFSLLL